MQGDTGTALGVPWGALAVLPQDSFSASVFMWFMSSCNSPTPGTPQGSVGDPGCASLGLAGTWCLLVFGCSLCWGPGLQAEDSISHGQHPPLHRAPAQFCHLVSPAIKKSQLRCSQKKKKTKLGVPQGRQRCGVVQKFHVSPA